MHRLLLVGEEKEIEVQNATDLQEREKSTTDNMYTSYHRGGAIGWGGGGWFCHDALMTRHFLASYAHDIEAAPWWKTN